MEDILDVYEHPPDILFFLPSQSLYDVHGHLYGVHHPRVPQIQRYYTPKHGSWLNIAEIELNVMTRQCLSRRIKHIEKLGQGCSRTLIWRTPPKGSTNTKILTVPLRVYSESIFRVSPERMERGSLFQPVKPDGLRENWKSTIHLSMEVG